MPGRFKELNAMAGREDARAPPWPDGEFSDKVQA